MNRDFDFSTRYLCQWSEIFKDIHDFRELVGDKLFECDFNPIFTELSRRSCRSYIDWLYDARNEICRGKDPYDVLSNYDIILRDLIKENKR